MFYSVLLTHLAIFPTLPLLTMIQDGRLQPLKSRGNAAVEPRQTKITASLPISQTNGRLPLARSDAQNHSGFRLSSLFIKTPRPLARHGIVKR